MANRLVKRSAIRFWIIPLIFFVISVQDEWLSKTLKIPSGIITTVIELFFSFQMIRYGTRAFDAGSRKYLAIPAFVAIGDLFYGFGNYVFKLPLPNQLGCLTYVIPYMGALVLISHGLYRLTKSAPESKRSLFWIGSAISLALFALSVVNIIWPALFLKQPPLTPLMKTLTILFSAAESPVIGFSITLLLCANAGMLQIGLFGVLVMHISDMALRYQSVKLDLMGISVFEYGWCFGLMLAYIAAAKFHDWRRIATIRNVPTWVPLSSIRGMTIGFVFTGFVVLWAALSIYHQSIDSAMYSASTLLILTMTFAFSVIVADFVTRQVTRVVLTIQNKEEFKAVLQAPLVPQEIKIITSHFERLTEECSADKDRVLKLTSTVTHDLRGPLRSIQNMIPFVKEAASEKCGCHEKVVSRLAVIEECVALMRKTITDLLKNRKEVVEGDPIGEAVHKAARLVELAHAKSKILVEAPSEVTGPRIQGLTRVLSNLLDNAVEASPKDEPVQLLLKQEKGRGYHILVKDHGTGIPDRVLELVEAGTPVSTKEDGNGLGLSFMVSWAKERGIEYKIVTAPGRGTEIALHIPAEI